MASKITISQAALRDIDEIVIYISKDSPTAAKNWYFGIRAAIKTLHELPERHALIEEAADIHLDFRCLHYKSHRIIYGVRSSEVFIVRIWHGAREALSRADLSDDL